MSGFHFRGGGGDRAPQNSGGGGKRAQLIDTILTNEKVKIHVFRSLFPEKFVPFAPTLAHMPLYPCAGAWMGGTHPCSHASLPMRWSVDGRHPPLLTRLSAHALERGWEAPTYVPEESMAEENEDEGEDIVCVHCLSGDASDGNNILICEGAHSAMVGWHQLCLTPPLQEIPTGCWLCLECVCAQVGPGAWLILTMHH